MSRRQLRTDEANEGVSSGDLLPSNALMKDPNFVRSGWLLKTSDNTFLRRLQKRFVVIARRRMYYFSRDGSDERNVELPKGVLNLDGSLLVVTRRYPRRPPALVVVTRTGREFVFCVDTDDEATAWAESIRGAADVQVGTADDLEAALRGGAVGGGDEFDDDGPLSAEEAAMLARALQESEQGEEEEDEGMEQDGKEDKEDAAAEFLELENSNSKKSLDAARQSGPPPGILEPRDMKKEEEEEEDEEEPKVDDVLPPRLGAHLRDRVKRMAQELGTARRTTAALERELQAAHAENEAVAGSLAATERERERLHVRAEELESQVAELAAGRARLVAAAGGAAAMATQIAAALASSIRASGAWADDDLTKALYAEGASREAVEAEKVALEKARIVAQALIRSGLASEDGTVGGTIDTSPLPTKSSEPATSSHPPPTEQPPKPSSSTFDPDQLEKTAKAVVQSRDAQWTNALTVTGVPSVVAARVIAAVRREKIPDGTEEK